MAKSLQEARGSLMSDIETLNNLLNSLGETWWEMGHRFQGKGWALGGQASPAHWYSCLMASQAEPGALWLRSSMVSARLF